MNLRKLTALTVMALMMTAPATPAFAVSKEIIQLQTQMQDLTDRVAHMQQSFDENMGVLRNLVTQSTDNVNKLSGSLQTVEKELQQQNGDSAAKIDQVSGQLQVLNDSIDELRARLEKTSKQLADIEAQQQNIVPQQTQQPLQPATPTGGAPDATAPGGQVATVTPPALPGAAEQAPPADVLYNNALRDFVAARYDLAISQFRDYLKYYPTTDLAGNAQYYVADIEYRGGNFDAAVADYDKVLEEFPGSNKTAAAQLKKGYSLLELGHKDAGIRELNALVQRYPRSIEATQARERLHKLGAAAKPGPVKPYAAH